MKSSTDPITRVITFMYGGTTPYLEKTFMKERLQKLLKKLDETSLKLRQELHRDGIRLETIDKASIILEEMTIIIDKKIGARPEAPVEDAIEDTQSEVDIHELLK